MTSRFPGCCSRIASVARKYLGLRCRLCMSPATIRLSERMRARPIQLPSVLSKRWNSQRPKPNALRANTTRTERFPSTTAVGESAFELRSCVPCSPTPTRFRNEELALHDERLAVQPAHFRITRSRRPLRPQPAATARMRRGRERQSESSGRDPSPLRRALTVEASSATAPVRGSAASLNTRKQQWESPALLGQRPREKAVAFLRSAPTQ